MKVLVAGAWHDAGSDYTVLFDSVSVPASLVQQGLLRCYTPGRCCHGNSRCPPGHVLQCCDIASSLVCHTFLSVTKLAVSKQVGRVFLCIKTWIMHVLYLQQLA